MAQAKMPQQWPPYPHIPIYLETSDNIGTTRSYRSLSPMPTSPDSRTEKRSIHCLAAASAQFSNIPAHTSPVSPATQFTNLSPIWPIPEPLPAPPPEVAQQRSKRPALRFFPTDRPRIQLATSISRESQPSVEKQCQSPEIQRSDEAKGLGILNRPSSLAMSSISESGGSSPNIAQRIEQRLWRYTSSRSVVKRWLLEIISWSFSALCMGAIVVTLFILKNDRLPKWPQGLTLNAYIAVLSKISGAALILPTSEALGQLKWSWFQGDSKKMWDFEIFDNASRGPWGSFLLLMRTKGRSLAALGAIITLFSLALDPFFQQVVDFPDRWAPMGNSSIPVVNVYKPHFGTDFKNGVPIIQSDQDIEAITQKFLYDNGTQPMQVANGTRPEIPLNCPSSNCTWPVYETLGVCSACEDVSELLTWSCLTTIVDWTPKLNGSGFESTYPNGTMCGYFFNATSEKPVFMSGYMADQRNRSTGDEMLLMRTLPLFSNPSRKPIYGGSYKFKHIRNPIADFFVVSAVNGSESVLKKLPPVALECMLTWCVKRMNSTYYAGAYNEEVIEEFINKTAGPSPLLSSPVTLAGFTGYNQMYTQNVTIEVPGYEASTFGVSNDTAMYTIGIFDNFLPSWTTISSVSPQPILRYKFAGEKLPFWRQTDINPWLGPNNITNHMDRLATALTNGIRSSRNSKQMYGVAYHTEAYVSVRWVWLILPIGLLVLSAVFLISTIVTTAKGGNDVGVWKTSAIATLLYGLPDDMQAKITSSAAKDSDIGTPRAKAKELKVKLLPKKGWRVSGNLFSPMTPKPHSNPPPGWI